MIYRVERALRWARRLFSRSEWAIRLLGLAATDEPSTAPGLVMIQIDGLSRAQFNRALEAGRLPFLRSLIDRDHYVDRAFYSGLPSSTPAVQGELFYGVKVAVPAFSFRAEKDGEIVRMWEPATADAVERRLGDQGTALLAGGSSYSNIYAGGAAEAHFCPSRMGWGDLLRGANPLAVAVLGLANAYSLVRAMALLVVEAALAPIDFVKGFVGGYNLRRELRFVPTRVGICVLLRELVTIGAKIDVARGLPIVHLNLLGYDEQAHRRGPGSGFAHWALKGIDDAVSRIWRAAKRSKRRDYEVWIYSDHGQEACQPYASVTGRDIETTVAALLHGPAEATPPGGAGQYGVQSHRIRVLSANDRWQRWLPTYGAAPVEADRLAEVAAMGPIAHLYLRRTVVREELVALAERLAAAESVPLVLAPSVAGQADAWTAEGRFTLPDETASVMGREHPHLASIGDDLVALAHHPQAGDLILCGWRHGSGPISFAVENGAHGGAGPEETAGFALLPEDAP
ncbi:MAG: oxidoreductase, partial [Inquilinus sp.]|nr:oxidoreductase [Inquilinus sp.]